MKKKGAGFPIPGYKLVEGKLVRDQASAMAKLSVNKRIAMRKSKKVTVSKARRLNVNRPI